MRQPHSAAVMATLVFLVLPAHMLLSDTVFSWLQAGPSSSHTARSPPVLSNGAHLASMPSTLAAASVRPEASSRLPWVWAALLGVCFAQRFPTLQSRRNREGQRCVIACQAMAQYDEAASNLQLHVERSTAVQCCSVATAMLVPTSEVLSSLPLDSACPRAGVSCRESGSASHLAGTALRAGQARHASRRRTKSRATRSGRRRIGARLQAAALNFSEGVALPELSFDPSRQRMRLQFGLQSAQGVQRQPAVPAVSARHLHGALGAKTHTIRVHNCYVQTQIIDTCAATCGSQTATDPGASGCLCSRALSIA